MEDEKIIGIAQFFFHCRNQVLPIRDILNTNGRGHKTEPHYENLTENWCSECVQKKIKSANSKNLDYLFLYTHYHCKKQDNDDKYLIVGYLKRAKPERWLELNKGLRTDAEPYSQKNPELCGFFAGDLKASRFVSADNAYILYIKHPYEKYFIKEKEAEKIINKLKLAPNILKDLKKLAIKLDKQIIKISGCKKRKKCL